jgi:hypothetical protein
VVTHYVDADRQALEDEAVRAVIDALTDGIGKLAYGSIPRIARVAVSMVMHVMDQPG